MLAEKLLLQMLIVLAPVLFYSVLLEKSRWAESPYLSGILNGAAASLSLLFSFYEYGIYWDLRYIPLVLAVLYGGTKAGLIVFASLLLTRTYLGGDTLVYGYIAIFLALSVLLLVYRKFWKCTPDKRWKMAIVIGFWPVIVQLCILFAIVEEKQIIFPVTWYQLTMYCVLFGCIQIIGVGCAAILNESIIERSYMKIEIQRAEKLNTIGELAASIAHEVRNPLTVVKGFLQLMERDQTLNSKQYIPLVLSELGRAESIISDYLNFAKPEFRKMEKFNAADFLHDLALLLNPLALKNGVVIEEIYKKSVLLYTDKSQLKQALVNMVKNAIEATDQGGKVSIILEGSNAEAFITIKDTGKGMSEEQLERIGTLFYTTKDKGTGLGTVVSLRIIESMNGTVQYDSKKGKGTVVTVTLPAEESQVEQDQVTKELVHN
ncbi:ATP-binding protein [Fictibacillus aquaticus]|uniref:histidine kinase n=1 Tax=Fictibacillus aquaticus TaxID=2021314 RepID=A0A235F5N2_9BACL|nr:ATP-binding protein [Fictibacillus aquaticus]OYD56532.1 two-component sensor histidine kinase [Fictibacillus aquaticus]